MSFGQFLTALTALTICTMLWTYEKLSKTVRNMSKTCPISNTGVVNIYLFFRL
ncbi:4535_t:CDS:1, partial [Gigaspora margarita]